MISETKMGIASTIKDVLKVEAKKALCSELEKGEYFEYIGKICIYIGDGYAMDDEGWKIHLDPYEVVLPVKVKLEYDYHLIDVDGKELLL